MVILVNAKIITYLCSKHFQIPRMDFFYLGILVFLLVLATFDLSVGVANDAVNFLSPAVGAKAAKFRTILIVAAVGIFVGASTSGGMMDIARHGILHPNMYYFDDVMCIFLSVAATDVILLDIFNTLGMPTSTTVSLVFELLGGSTALAMSKILANGLTYANLINTDKALSVIIGIFLSVAIAFVFGLVVMWIARLVFTFNYVKHLRWSIAIFGGISITSIAYFLLVCGMQSASFMSPDILEWINSHRLLLVVSCFFISSAIVEILHLCHVNVFKIIVLFGTFSLAMAFAGNDLVNFIGVPLAGLESFLNFSATPNANAHLYTMDVLAAPSTLPHMHLYLILAGLIMTIAIFKSKKARKVIDTSVNLARQDDSEEAFSSSRIARRMVRNVLNASNRGSKFIPHRVKHWINTRFNTDEAILSDGMAFDLVRASVNLVLGGLLIVIGTSLQLPLSTTYVAFMVAMGSSLADRAWGRETAVYRVTGVITVIGGWFVTAGAAFILSFLIAMLNHIGGFIAMVLVMVLVVAVLVNNNRKFKKKDENEPVDTLFREMASCHDKSQTWELLLRHVRLAQGNLLSVSQNALTNIINGVTTENIKQLRQTSRQLDTERNILKRYRKKEILGMRKIDHLLAVEKNTWFHIGCNNSSQIIYCLKRMLEPCIEHVDNNFPPLPKNYKAELHSILLQVIPLLQGAENAIREGNFSDADALLVEGNSLKTNLSALRHKQQNVIQREDSNIQVDLLYLNTLQEIQELISMTRHLIRASKRFQCPISSLNEKETASPEFTDNELLTT